MANMKRKLFLLPALFLAACTLVQGATYYVDSSKGDDANNGLSEASPWKTLAKINSSKFATGDIILLRRGAIWREQLNFPSSACPSAPIVIGSYGSGELPLISGADVVPAESWSPCQSCGANIWEAPVSVKANVVIFDGTKGNRKSTSTELSNPGDWFWDSSTLYVYSREEPSAA